MKTENNLIVELTIEFSLLLIPYCEQLDQLKKYVISKQLLEAGTSVGANVHEAQSPESKMDFIHKMKIAAKEASETEYWLILCSRSPTYPDCNHLLEKIKPITRVLNSIISTSRKSVKR